MIDRLDDYLVGIVVGVRFRPNFSIEDQLGAITDTILYTKNSFFDSQVFPEVSTNFGRKILFNRSTDDKLHIDSSNIILEMNFGEGLTFDKKDFISVLENFEEQILNSLLKKFRIEEIVRIGYVRRYLFTIETLANSFVGKTIGNTLEGVNDINLRFSKKIALEEALIKKDVNDYDNAIFNVIKRADMKEIFMSLDYQSYFDPFLPTSSMIQFKQFIHRADGFNSNKYLNWLNSNYVEAE